MDFKLFYVLLYLCVLRFSDAQLTEYIPTDVICSSCICGQSKLDCHGKDIRSPFSIEDWLNLTIQPLEVDLSNNRLTTFTKMPPLLVQTLNLSNCDLENLEHESFMNLEELKSLDLSFNKLSTTAINKMVFVGLLQPGKPPQRFKKLTNLNLSNNDICSLQQDIFSCMTDITHLDLSNNPLAYIDQVTMAAISDLVILKQLNLASCELEILPEGLLRRLGTLEYLDLGNNRFSTVPAVLSEAPNLIYLRLDRNPIDVISETPFKSLKKLTQLSLKRLSKLQSISAFSLGGLERLKILDMSYNHRLTNLDPKFLAWTDENDVERYPVLNELHLNNNNLSSISSEYLDRWDQVDIIDVTNNPYICDCSNQWMIDVLLPLLEGKPLCGSAENMVCKSPPTARGLTFKHLERSGKPLACMEDQTMSLTKADADGIVLVGIMIGIFVTFPMVLITTLVWKKGYFTKCRRRRVMFEDDFSFNDH